MILPPLRVEILKIAKDLPRWKRWNRLSMTLSILKEDSKLRKRSTLRVVTKRETQETAGAIKGSRYLHQNARMFTITSKIQLAKYSSAI